MPIYIKLKDLLSILTAIFYPGLNINEQHRSDFFSFLRLVI